MKIFSIYPRNNYDNSAIFLKPSFEAKGMPLALKDIVEKRAHLLPEKVLNEAKRLLATEETENLPSLLEIHQKIYRPLLSYEALDKIDPVEFPEFANVLEEVLFKKNNHYKKAFEERFAGVSFALKMLKEYWVELKSLKEISESLGLKNRASLEWALQQIGFPKFKNGYKNLLLASDDEGTKILAKRVTDYDAQNSARREAISEAMYARWLANPEIQVAMSEFAKSEGAIYRKVLDKISAGKPLNSTEKRINKGFFKRFWTAHPNLKKDNK